MSHTKNNICKGLFAICFCLACFTMNSDNLSGYLGNNGTPFILFRLILIFIFVVALTAVNKSNVDFVSKFTPIASIIITTILIFDYYVTNISGSQFLFRIWWIASIFVVLLGVFVAITIFRFSNYPIVYRRVWEGFTPLYLFTLIICFARSPFTSRTINTVPFHGTFLMLKAFINNPHVSFEAPLMFFGNLLIFVPLPFILSIFIKKARNALPIALIGIATPLIVEGYQYIFSCGDVDIDDLILNWLGFAIGFIAQQIINKTLLRIK